MCRQEGKWNIENGDDHDAVRQTGEEKRRRERRAVEVGYIYGTRILRTTKQI
jgi:hypothetical protein